MDELYKTLITDRNINLSKYYQNNAFFGQSFVINLNTRKERWSQSSQLLNKIGLSPIRFEAIWGKDITDTNFLESCKNLSLAERGCLLSHLCILYLASQHPNKNHFTLIFEDDITTNIDSITPILNKLQHRCQDIDIIYFGKCFETCTEILNIEDNIYTGYAPLCAHAYAIRNSFAQYVLNALCKYKYYDQIDVIYKKMCQNDEVRSLVFHPSIFIQDFKLESDLRNRIGQIYNITECIEAVKKNNTENNLHWLWILLIVLIFLIMIGFIFYLCKTYQYF